MYGTATTTVASLTRESSPLIRLLIFVFCMVSANGCEKKSSGGGDNSGTAIGEGGLSGWSVDNEQLVISPKGIKAGQQYLLMPFATGDLERVTGAGDESLTLTVSKSTVSKAGLRESWNSYPLSVAGGKTWQETDYLRRSMLNRMQVLQGSAQDAGFWAAARGLGAVAEVFEERLAQSHSEEFELTVAAENFSDSCPTDSVLVPRWTNADTPTTLSVDVETSFDGTDYCLAIVDGTTLVSEPDLQVLKSSLSETMRRYKSVIYADAFAANVKDGYAFKPLVVVADFSDASIWPDPNVADADLKAINSTYQVAGVFSSDMTSAAKRPVLYMAADIAKVKGAEGTSADLARRTFHATIAHEMQHAIQDYYRRRGAADAPETLFIDEGIAHYMEDLFGYGEVSFDGFPKVFLTSLLDGTTPFLGSAEDSKAQRGAGQALIYYLVSQKGGVTFSGGNFIAGPGLASLASLVKNPAAIGARSLVLAFGSDWFSTVGGFLGALVLDGTGVNSQDKRFQVQTPGDGVKDLQGVGTKKYGMRFNGFGGLADRLSKYTSAIDKDLAKDGKPLKYYQTVPLLWTVGKDGESMNLGLSTASGRYVQYVRIK